MSATPRDPRFDSSLALLADPYRYISSQARKFNSDVFEARIMLRRTLCMTGPQAAEVFYDQTRLQRRGAAPEPLRATLFGKGGVQGLDDAAHRQRKAVFMRLVGEAQTRSLADLFAEEWQHAAARGQDGPVDLYSMVQGLLTRGVCRWAGVPLPEPDVARRTGQLVALFDQAAAVGSGHFRARMARKQAEQWLAELIQRVRTGGLEIPDDRALAVVARHPEAGGDRMASRVAAVELLNLLRPTVAVSVFIVFVAHALHLHRHCREALARGDTGYLDAFVQEIRRWYPFFPAVAAKVRQDFEWNGHHFPGGRRVMLDLYGTNHDPRAWESPDTFRPERFLERPPTPFDFVPQGGSEPLHNHRCPGEGVAVALMKVAVDFLIRRLRYRMPEQDLTIDFTRLPALPRDHLVLADIRLVE